jgi:predicted enzyme related to lactoylglutathione lyase
MVVRTSAMEVLMQESQPLRTYPAGVPCWVDVEARDVPAAADFYGTLFGWTYAEAGEPGSATPYLFAQLEGLDVGAIQAGDSGAGWVSYISCDDIEEACARIQRAGGEVTTPPSSGDEYGRSATCRDPLGAVFRLWQPGTHPGSQIVNSPGAWNFSDLHTPDPAASLAFYGDVFGWTVDPGLGAGMIRLPGYGDHLAATVDPDIHARQELAPEGFADVIAGLTPDPAASSWQIRFTVADRDESVGIAAGLGATIESQADTEWTKEAVVVDPQGARFIVSQFAPREA